MSNLTYNGVLQTQHTLFTSARQRNGALAVRQGIPFGGQWGSVLIGPDISLPGGITNNPPTAVGNIWNVLVPGGPPLTFVQDANFKWKRGHLVNGEWSGPGNLWENLTPLTPTANSNHTTVENYMRTFCNACLQYDVSPQGYKADWYGVQYIVQCSNDPWAQAPAAADLYSYAPAFIKVSWRAVSIQKPNLAASAIQFYLDNLATRNPVAAFPGGFNVPVIPAAIAGATVPPGNAAGGNVHGPAVPPAQANGFDGQIEVHQS